jgi:hypothetical protein
LPVTWQTRAIKHLSRNGPKTPVPFGIDDLRARFTMALMAPTSAARSPKF